MTDPPDAHLRAIAALVGAEPDLAKLRTGAIEGKALGPLVSVYFAARGTSSSTTYWTEVSAELPEGYPIVMEVRRHRARDAAHIARGTMVDVTVGDPAFDAAFLVEGAPADVVRGMFDDDLRALLTREAGQFETIDTPSPRIRFRVEGWRDSIDAIRPWAQIVAATAMRVRDAYAAADRAATTREAGGGPFREHVSETPDADLERRRRAEIANLEALRQRRTAIGCAILAVLALVGFLLVYAIAAAGR